jgi:hypothetical protein
VNLDGFPAQAMLAVEEPDSGDQGAAANVLRVRGRILLQPLDQVVAGFLHLRLQGRGDPTVASYVGKLNDHYRSGFSGVDDVDMDVLIIALQALSLQVDTYLPDRDFDDGCAIEFYLALEDPSELATAWIHRSAFERACFQ